jgi:hypothetical protein
VSSRFAPPTIVQKREFQLTRIVVALQTQPTFGSQLSLERLDEGLIKRISLRVQFRSGRR